MKKKIISDVRIVCEPPSVPLYIKNNVDSIVDYYNSWIREFNEFIRDHRSQDPVSLSVEREYKYVCSHCGYEYNDDRCEYPECCDKAQAEYKELNKI